VTGAFARPSIADIVSAAPWTSLEVHLDGLTARVDAGLERAHDLRAEYRRELLARNPDLANAVRRPSEVTLRGAEALLSSGTVAAADGTVDAVPLLTGSKIQVGVVLVSNRGDVVDLVTRIFEYELASAATTATDFFAQLRTARSVSNLVSRAVMLFGERRLLRDHPADWRLIHGELMPHELRTGAGRPDANLPPTFDLVRSYVASEQFLAVSESPQDLDILNAAVLLEPGEYIVIRSLTDTLNIFLDGDPTVGTVRANFAAADERRFREFIAAVGPEVAVVLAKAGNTPFLLECHARRVEEAVALFMADALWTRGLDSAGSSMAVRPFPFHIDLADQVARTLFKGSDFTAFVEARLAMTGGDTALFDLDPRRTRG
jgi:hypothetical protein